MFSPPAFFSPAHKGGVMQGFQPIRRQVFDYLDTLTKGVITRDELKKVENYTWDDFQKDEFWHTVSILLTQRFNLSTERFVHYLQSWVLFINNRIVFSCVSCGKDDASIVEV